VIILDTHVWVWWSLEPGRLSLRQLAMIEAATPAAPVGISEISVWEVAKLVQLSRLELPVPVDVWVRDALAFPTVTLVPLSPMVAIASTQLPASFHRDPADEMLVATARVHGCPLLTCDRKLLNYPHVETVG
jgi:PIN domain nuclease of toxin-antitoxin system